MEEMENMEMEDSCVKLAIRLWQGHKKSKAAKVQILFGPLAPKWASVNKIGPEVSMGTDVRISRLSINEKRSWELHVNVYKNFEFIYFIFPYPHIWTKVPLVLLF